MVVNLDKVAFEFGLSVENIDKEATINKILGCLEEDGPFAMTILLNSMKESDKGNLEEIIAKYLSKILDIEISKDNLRDKIKEHADTLQDLLFLKESLERMLIYTRYKIKAEEK